MGESNRSSSRAGSATPRSASTPRSPSRRSSCSALETREPLERALDEARAQRRSQLVARAMSNLALGSAVHGVIRAGRALDRGRAGALRGPRARPLAARPALPARAARARSRRLDGCDRDRGSDRRRGTRLARAAAAGAARARARACAPRRSRHRLRCSPRRRRSPQRRAIRAGMRLWRARGGGRMARAAPRGGARGDQATYERERVAASSWWLGELAYWRRKNGIVEDVPDDGDEPWSLQLAGDWRGAAAAWRGRDRPYETALALSEADDEEALRASLAELQRLGAGPLARMVARRLREVAHGTSRADRAGRPGRTPASSPLGSSRSSGSSPTGFATRRSPSGCFSPLAPSTTTSRRSSASSTRGRAARRSQLQVVSASSTLPSSVSRRT